MRTVKQKAGGSRLLTVFTNVHLRPSNCGLWLVPIVPETVVLRFARATLYVMSSSIKVLVQVVGIQLVIRQGVTYVIP